MRCVIQRVKYATCVVDDKLISEISKGLLVFVGFSNNDSYDDIDKMVEKLINLRILSNEFKALNYSILDLNASIMLIPNFTLYANTQKGRRPSFELVGDKEESKLKYIYMLNKFKEKGIKLGYGEYSADMQINLQNDGPITLIIES